MKLSQKRPVDTRRLVERMEKSKPRYTPVNETDDGDMAGIVLIGGTLFVLVLLFLIFRS